MQHKQSMGKRNLRQDSGLTRFTAPLQYICIFWSYSLFLLLTLFLPTVHNLTYGNLQLNTE